MFYTRLSTNFQPKTAPLSRRQILKGMMGLSPALIWPNTAFSAMLPIRQPTPPMATTLLDKEGKPLSLYVFRGMPILINFWATWCSPCLKEMPDLDQVYQSLGPENLIVLAVSMGESRERVRKFLKKRNYSFPVMTDPEMEITRLYGVRNIPITYLVDPSGVIIGRALGPREWSEPKLLKFFRSRMNRQAG